MKYFIAVLVAWCVVFTGLNSVSAEYASSGGGGGSGGGGSTATPVLTVLFPNGGETFRVGEIATLRWALAGFASFTGDQGIQLQLWSGEAARFVGTICPDCGGSVSGGSVEWRVGSVLAGSGTHTTVEAGSYTIRASVVSNVRLPSSSYAVDFSDAPFTIAGTLKVPVWGAEPGKSMVRGQSYQFMGQVTNGMPNARVILYLQRPDGTFKYDEQNDILLKGTSYTDASGYWKMSADQTLTPEGQVGTWTSWVTVGGVASNRMEHSVIAPPSPPVPPTYPPACLPDGTLIKMPSDPKVYVIEQCQKRWIQSAEEFKRGGYRWEKVETVASSVGEAYAETLKTQAKLIKAIGDEKIYRVVEGKRLWVPSVDAFQALGLTWEGLANTSKSEVAKYPRASLLRVKGDDRIFFITESGLKRHITSPEVFRSYGNKWEDVLEVTPTDLGVYADDTLIRRQGNERVYTLENGQKRWIPTLEVLIRHNLDGTRVSPVNETEFNAYPEGAPLE